VGVDERKQQHQLQPGVYGTLGTPATGNVLGAVFTLQAGSTTTAIYGSSAARGSPHRLGGLVQRPVGLRSFNSLWAWMGGVSGIGSNKWLSPSGYIYGQPGFYGTVDVPEPSNDPGARQTTTTWTDNSGNLCSSVRRFRWQW